MRELTLLISINRPAEEVFAFVINPNNTPKWIEAIDHEEVNESPIKLGTIYRNRSSNGKWSEYQMTSFEPNEMFVMSKIDDNYHVRYSLKPIDNSQTELEYHEWADEGHLEEPFTDETLQKLKAAIEQG